MTHTTIHKIRQEIHPEEKSETNRKKKQKYTHTDYCLGVSHFFWKIIWYFQTEYFFSRTLFTLYQPRMIHEPRIKSAKPTKKPRSAGLKRIATPKMTQVIQKKSIKYSYKNSIDIFTIKQEKSQHHCWDLWEYLLDKLWKLIREFTVLRTYDSLFTDFSSCRILEIITSRAEICNQTWTVEKLLESHEHLVAWFTFLLCSVKTSHKSQITVK